VISFFYTQVIIVDSWPVDVDKFKFHLFSRASNLKVHAIWHQLHVLYPSFCCSCNLQYNLSTEILGRDIIKRWSPQNLVKSKIWNLKGQVWSEGSPRCHPTRIKTAMSFVTVIIKLHVSLICHRNTVFNNLNLFGDFFIWVYHVKLLTIRNNMPFLSPPTD